MPKGPIDSSIGETRYRMPSIPHRLDPFQRFAIVGDDTATIDLLLKVTEKLGYTCIAKASAAVQAFELVRFHQPQVCLLNIEPGDAVGLEALEQIVALGTTAVFVWSRNAQTDLTQRALALGATGFFVPPFDLAQLLAVIEGGWVQFQRAHALQAEVGQLRDQLETRKLVDRAKGILMAARGITEPEAYKLLQRMSQDKRMSMKDVCRAVEQIEMVVGSKVKKHAA